MKVAINQAEFDNEYGYLAQEDGLFRKFRHAYFDRFYKPFTSLRRFWDTIISFLPILSWLPRYSGTYLVPDIIGGLTVGIMHVPQGIAYALLAGQEPVIGLYISFFPGICYMIFGTSPHCSIGSFAVIALMTGKAVSRLTTPPEPLVSNEMFVGSTTPGYSTTEADSIPLMNDPNVVASTLAFTVGLMQVSMGLFRLDFVTSYFSDELVNGFTVGASIHVFVTQFKDIFGIYVKTKRHGIGNVLLKVYDLLLAYSQVNLAPVLISAVSIIILLLGNYYINPKVKEKLGCSVPVPFELILVILGTVISWQMNLEKAENVHVIGEIPIGFPAPSLPAWSLIPELLGDAVSISVVIMAIHISLAKMFATKYKYKIDVNQEFYAMGFVSLISSCFKTYPNACSLARTMVNANSGTKSQLSGLISSSFILSLMLFSGAWLQDLPMCILASIIVVALSGMLKKFKGLITLWSLSKIDFTIWIVSFITTAFLDVMPGLVISICFALFTTIARQQWANSTILGMVDEKDLFVDSKHYETAVELENVKIVRLNAPLTFINTEQFQQMVMSSLNVPDDDSFTDSSEVEKQSQIGMIIIDCSSMSYVDIMGTNAMKQVYIDLTANDCSVRFAAANTQLMDLFELLGHFEHVPKEAFYPSVANAVSYSSNNSSRKRNHHVTSKQLTENTALDNITSSNNSLDTG